MKQEMMGWQPSANHLHVAADRQPRQRLITHSVTPNQRCQSTEGNESK